MKSRIFLILALMVFLVSTGWVAGSQVKPRGWEYKFVPSGLYPENQQIMNQAGVDGWELVAVQPQENPNGVYLYFKRQK